MTLYEINKEIEQALNLIFESADPETGEVDEAYVHQLEDLNMQRDDKIENLGCYIKNLRADVAAIKEEEKNLKARRAALENKEARLTQYLTDMLGGERFDKSARVVIGWRKSTQVVIDNLDAIPAEYIREKVERTADKTAIKKAIDAGTAFEGAHIAESNNIQIK